MVIYDSYGVIRFSKSCSIILFSLIFFSIIESDSSGRKVRDAILSNDIDLSSDEDAPENKSVLVVIFFRKTRAFAPFFASSIAGNFSRFCASANIIKIKDMIKHRSFIIQHLPCLF